MKLHNDFGTRWLFRPDPETRRWIIYMGFFVAGSIFTAAMIPAIELMAR